MLFININPITAENEKPIKWNHLSQGPLVIGTDEDTLL